MTQPQLNIIVSWASIIGLYKKEEYLFSKLDKAFEAQT